MSIAALDWTFKQEALPASQKLTLLSLANHASDTEGLSYPSVETIVRETGLNQKTVRRALAACVAGHVIDDTSRRVGKTQQVRVYQFPVECQRLPKADALDVEKPPKESAKTPERLPKESQNRVAEPGTGNQESETVKGVSFEKPKRQWEADRAKPKAWDLKEQIEAIDEQIAAVKMRGFEDATGLQLSKEDWAELKALKAKRAEVVEKKANLTPTKK